jgi:hypothetical protein
LRQVVCSAAQQFILLGISAAAEQGQTEEGKQGRIPAALVVLIGITTERQLGLGRINCRNQVI